MKWTNKGHQFDEIGKKFTNPRYIAIYGAGARGKMVLQRFEEQGITVNFLVDKSDKSIGKYTVISPSDFFSRYKQDEVLLIISPDNRHIIEYNLIAKGFHYFYDADTFFRLYFPLFLLYRFDKLFVPEMNISVCEQCSLQCIHCSFGNSRIKASKKAENQAKILFDNVNFIEHLALVGGEPFLCEDIDNVLLSFISFKNKYNELRIVSNLFAEIKPSTIDILTDNHILIEYSNYNDSIFDSKIKQKILNNFHTLKASGVLIKEINHTYWVKYGMDTDDMKGNTDTFSQHFDDCHSMCRFIENGNLIQCYPAYRQRRQENREGNNMLSLNFESNLKKKIIFEYLYGFNDSGFIEQCKYCRGSMNINRRFCIPGEQPNRIDSLFVE